MSDIEITITEWLDALQSVTPRKSDAGLSSAELSDLWGIGMKTTSDRIRMLHRRGMVKVGQREGLSMLGRRILTPVYTITRPKAAKR